MEIKTVAIKIDGVLKCYHGIANTEEDAVAKDFGSAYDAVEVKFFTTLCQELVANKFMNTNDACKISPWGESGTKVDSRVQELLARFEDNKWLKRDSRGYFEVGIRAYLELSNYIKDSITALAEDEEEEEDEEKEEEEENDENNMSQNQSSTSVPSTSGTKRKKSTKTSTRMAATDIPQLIMY